MIDSRLEVTVGRFFSKDDASKLILILDELGVKEDGFLSTRKSCSRIRNQAIHELAQVSENWIWVLNTSKNPFQFQKNSKFESSSF